MKGGCVITPNLGCFCDNYLFIFEKYNSNTMKVISLLVYEDAVLSSVSGALDLLNAANGLLQSSGKPPAFKFELVSEKLKNIQLNLPAQFICSKTFSEVTHSDLILVPAFYIGPDEALNKNKTFISWIREMREKGTEIASLCMGSYFLAEAGILSGKSCTSHWMAIEDMKQRYPDVTVLSDVVMTDQEGIYTSGGALISWNLIIYLIEKFCGKETAVSISKMFNIDFNRESQTHFAVFQGQRRHEDDEILKAQVFIEQNYHKPISIEQIAEQTNMSTRNFIRRFKAATQNTPLEYLQRVKVESAKKSLESGTDSISSLMYDAGYNDLKTFRTIFKRITGLTPQEYRKKYSRMGVMVES